MRQTLSWWAPTAFVPRTFWPALTGADGTLERRTWELGLAVAIRDGLRSGDIDLPESRRQVSFPHLVYDPVRWQRERADAYAELQLPPAPGDFCARLQDAFDAAARQAAQGLPTNDFGRFAAAGCTAKSAMRWSSRRGSCTCATPSKAPCPGSVLRISWPRSMRGVTSRGRATVRMRTEPGWPMASRPYWPH